MKKLTLCAVLLLASISIEAQTPEKLSYQAIIRNSSDAILANQSVGIQISILQTSAVGSAVYVETQNPTTNDNGLITIEIGNGSVVSGTFSTIDWAANTYFVKTEIDPTGGSAYSITSTSQLMSVPYALHAKTADNFTGTITETDPEFIASDAYGISASDITNWDAKQDVIGDGDLTIARTSGLQTALDAKLETEVDGSVTNEIELPTGGSDGQVLKTDGSGNYAWVDQTSNTDTQLTETQVDNYVSDNGFLTSVIESNISGTLSISKINGLQTALDAKQVTIGDGDLTIARTSGLQTALDAKQATIGDGDLTIARTSGLQTALDAKQATIGDGDLTIARTDGLQTALDAKQATIGDGDLTIARTSGLQTALDAKQDVIGDGDLTIARTDGLQTALDAKLETETQNLENVLTESNDANAKSIVNVSQIAVGTNTPNTSAAVDINSTTGAFLLPRMTTNQRDALTAAAGMVIYNTDTYKFQGYDGYTTNGVDISEEDTTTGERINTNNLSQSFTAGISGELTQIDVNMATTSIFWDSNITLTLRDGAGPSGTVLFTQAVPTINPTGHTWYSISISGVSIVASNQYTISFTTTSTDSDSAIWNRSTSDLYSGGDAYYDGSAQSTDFAFKTYVTNTPEWVDLH